MITAGVRDDTATALVIRKRGDFVVGSPQLEGADGLEIFELEEELAGVRGLGPLEERGADGNAVEAGLSGADVVKGYDPRSPKSPA